MVVAAIPSSRAKTRAGSVNCQTDSPAAREREAVLEQELAEHLDKPAVPVVVEPPSKAVAAAAAPSVRVARERQHSLFDDGPDNRLPQIHLLDAPPAQQGGYDEARGSAVITRATPTSGAAWQASISGATSSLPGWRIVLAQSATSIALANRRAEMRLPRSSSRRTSGEAAWRASGPVSAASPA